MDLRHLRYFLAVAEELHFGRAAERLNIVQPALSMQIRALEEEVGGSLFVRSSRHVQLTDAGALMMVEARRTIAQAERAKLIVQRSLRGEIGSVRVGFAGTAALAGTLMRDLRAFHQDYPDAQIELVEISPHLQQAALIDGRMDVGYCTSLKFEFDASLVTQSTGEWPMVIALASDHCLANQRRLTIQSLASEPFILYGADEEIEGPLTHLRQLIGNETWVVHRVANTLTGLTMVAAGLGLALVPRPIANVSIPNVSYREIEGASVMTDLMVVSRADESSGAVLAFLALAGRHDGAPKPPPQS